jgi:hypothetical protein
MPATLSKERFAFFDIPGSGNGQATQQHSQREPREQYRTTYPVACASHPMKTPDHLSPLLWNACYGCLNVIM